MVLSCFCMSFLEYSALAFYFRFISVFLCLCDAVFYVFVCLSVSANHLANKLHI